MKKILIAGASGLIGRHLSKFLKEEGYQVSYLSRAPQVDRTEKAYTWDPEKGILPREALRNQDVIINLAGAGIAERRWTEERKEILLQSRLQSTKLLVNSLTKNSIRPELFINASAIGYYPKNTAAKNTEDSTAGKDFLSGICQQWESAAEPLHQAGIPLTILRFGIILSISGGSFPKLISPLKFRINPVLGSGHQYISWMHIEDVCTMVHALISKKLRTGVYNMVAPKYHTLSAFNETALSVMHHKALKIPIPAIILSLFMGELSSLLLDSQKVIPTRLSMQGFKFKFPDLEGAIADLLKRT